MQDKKVSSGPSPAQLYRSIALLDPGNAKCLENAARIVPVASNPVIDAMFGEGSADRAVKFLEDHLAEIAQRRFEQVEAMRSKYQIVDDAVMGRKTLSDVVRSSFIEPLKAVPHRYFTSVKDITDFEGSILREYSSGFKPAGDDLASVFGDTPFPEAGQTGRDRGFFYCFEKGLGIGLAGIAAFAAGLLLPGGETPLILGVLETGLMGYMGFSQLSDAEKHRLKLLVSSFENVNMQASVLDRRISTTYEAVKQKKVCELPHSS